MHSEMGPVWQNSIQSCSSKCAYDTIQHVTVLIISPLTSRQTS